jgi:spermidine synthase
VLIGGLGMACTLRAALDALPAGAAVVVAELHETIVRWCRGPLAGLSGGAVDDPRVEVRVGDVAEAIRAAAAPSGPRFDAVMLDLYEGPYPAAQPTAHPHYGPAALARTRAALAPGGVFAVWSEEPDARFERALAAAGFAVRRERPGRGGRRHAVYVANAR